MAEPSSSQPLRGAIVAHPYASLGGCYDDPVVSFIGGELLGNGYVVGTFNFRGAADSDGRTSWTARPEVADYVSFYGFMLNYLHMLSKSGSRSDDAPTPEHGGSSTDVQLVLSGYSFGSLIASNLPAISVIADIFNGSVDSTAVREIFLAARDMYGLSVGDTPQKKQAFAPQGACFIDPTKTSISYLLISPLLPPVSQFLTLFSKLWLEVRDGPSGKQREIPCPKPIDQLCTCPTLAIYGDDDTFTSASKLRKWTEELKKVPGSKFQSVEVGGAGHFWREAGAESRAKDAVNNWLRQLS
jgi:alpha/beta superfamily hydrolase